MISDIDTFTNVHEINLNLQRGRGITVVDCHVAMETTDGEANQGNFVGAMAFRRHGVNMQRGRTTLHSVFIARKSYLNDLRQFPGSALRFSLFGRFSWSNVSAAKIGFSDSLAFIIHFNIPFLSISFKSRLNAITHFTNPNKLHAARNW